MSSQADARLGARSRIGFNGQLHESGTAWQLLGNGYRTYSPALMRFQSADPLSPFGRGGINSVAYCLGDPVNRVDPDGDFSWWIVAAASMGAAAAGATVGAIVVDEPAVKATLGTVAGLLAVGALAATPLRGKPLASHLFKRRSSPSLPTPSPSPMSSLNPSPTSMQRYTSAVAHNLKYPMNKVPMPMEAYLARSRQIKAQNVFGGSRLVKIGPASAHSHVRELSFSSTSSSGSSASGSLSRTSSMRSGILHLRRNSYRGSSSGQGSGYVFESGA